jgi:hypothetical protein
VRTERTSIHRFRKVPRFWFSHVMDAKFDNTGRFTKLFNTIVLSGERHAFRATVSLICSLRGFFLPKPVYQFALQTMTWPIHGFSVAMNTVILSKVDAASSWSLLTRPRELPYEHLKPLPQLPKRVNTIRHAPEISLRYDRPIDQDYDLGFESCFSIHTS